MDLLPESGFADRMLVSCSSHHDTSPFSDVYSTSDRDDQEEGIGS